MTDLPIACTLTPYALSARRAGLLSDLLRWTEGREELHGGQTRERPLCDCE